MSWRGDAYAVVEITSIGDQHVFDGTVSGTISSPVALVCTIRWNKMPTLSSCIDQTPLTATITWGEADFHYAKHRNGQTKTVTAHQRTCHASPTWLGDMRMCGVSQA